MISERCEREAHVMLSLCCLQFMIVSIGNKTFLETYQHYVFLLDPPHFRGPSPELFVGLKKSHPSASGLICCPFRVMRLRWSLATRSLHVKTCVFLASLLEEMAFLRTPRGYLHHQESTLFPRYQYHLFNTMVFTHICYACGLIHSQLDFGGCPFSTLMRVT